MKPTKSTLSPHAVPFVPRSEPTFADVDRSVSSSSVNTFYSSSSFQPQVFNASLEDSYGGQYNNIIPYHSADVWAPRPPTPVSTSPSQSYSSPNDIFTLSPCSTLKKLEIASDPNSELSADDADSPCYKGRNWSQTTPFHIGETSAPPRVTVKKLGEDPDLSVDVIPAAHLMVSNEKENRHSAAVPVRPLDSGPVGSSGGNLINQNLDPGVLQGSSGAKMVLQEMVDLSYMLLQIPSNAAKLDKGDEMKLEMTIEHLKKLLEKTEKGFLSEYTKAYRLDKDKGKEEAHSASCSQNLQKWYSEDNEATIEANVYKRLLINADREKCELKHKIQNAWMVVDTGAEE